MRTLIFHVYRHINITGAQTKEERQKEDPQIKESSFTQDDSGSRIQIFSIFSLFPFQRTHGCSLCSSKRKLPDSSSLSKMFAWNACDLFCRCSTRRQTTSLVCVFPDCPQAQNVRNHRYNHWNDCSLSATSFFSPSLSSPCLSRGMCCSALASRYCLYVVVAVLWAVTLTFLLCDCNEDSKLLFWLCC